MKQVLKDIIIYLAGITVFEIAWALIAMLFIFVLSISRNLTLMKRLTNLERLVYGFSKGMFLTCLAASLSFYSDWYFQVLIAVISYFYLVQLEHSKEYYESQSVKKNKFFEREFQDNDNFNFMLSFLAIYIITISLLFGLSVNFTSVQELVNSFISIYTKKWVFIFGSMFVIAAVIGAIVTARRYRRIKRSVKSSDII